MLSPSVVSTCVGPLEGGDDPHWPVTHPRCPRRYGLRSPRSLSPIHSVRGGASILYPDSQMDRKDFASG